MADQVTLEVQRRQITGKKVRRLRRAGIIPANIYGRGSESMPIQLNALEFTRFLKAHGPTTILRLTVGNGDGNAAVVRHVQREPATGAIQHVDFMHIEMTEPIRARIPIRIDGEAPAVKSDDGILLHLLESIEVEALPADLPESITVDVTPLAELNQSLHVSDLHVPTSVTVLTDADELIVKIERPRVIVEPTEAAPEAPAPEAEAPSAVSVEGEPSAEPAE